MSSSKFVPGFGDWVCADPKCGNINFAKRDKCNKCNKSKELVENIKKTNIEIGKAAAEKSKGLFSPDDWACKSCGNINWSRRSTCNVCNAPKVNLLGQRTGHGGGFMERDEQVEYDKHDSDDEFDEFGRKKKSHEKSADRKSDKISTKNAEVLDSKNKSGNNAVEIEESDNENDDDEEEEEEDEGADLSKYDIWADLAPPGGDITNKSGTLKQQKSAEVSGKSKDVSSDEDNSNDDESSNSESDANSSSDGSSQSRGSSVDRRRTNGAKNKNNTSKSNHRKEFPSSKSGSRSRSRSPWSSKH